MLLSQDDRIAISKKVVTIPKEIEEANNIKAILDKAKEEAQKKDNANRNVASSYTVLINQYQIESSHYESNIRTELIEQNFLDSANHLVGNFFNPNQPSIPTPSLPSGMWINFPPYSKTIAIGKKYDESYDIASSNEQILISTVNGYIATMETHSNISKSTGQICNSSGSCSIPAYITQPTCVGATPTPGIWTSGIDIISNDPIMQSLSSDLITAVANWQTSYNNTKLIINAVNDSNSSRNSGNITASGQITTTNNYVVSWQNLPDFSTAHGQTTCIGFYSYDVNLLPETKYRVDGLTVLKNAIAQRSIDITNRISSLSTAYLGSVAQANDGTITSATGLYGSRFRFIDLRLNLMSGTLNTLLSIDAGKAAQDQSILSNNSAQLAYSDIIKASIFSAPSIGTANIHIKDASVFSVSDNVYVVADGQNEIVASISVITGNMVTLNVTIPVKYRDSSFARVYKVL